MLTALAGVGEAHSQSLLSFYNGVAPSTPESGSVLLGTAPGVIQGSIDCLVTCSSVSQNGNSNIANTTQFGGTGNRALIEQNGNSNSHGIVQNGSGNVAAVGVYAGPGGAVSTGNTGSIIQQGVDNTAGALVVGSRNQFMIAQRPDLATGNLQALGNIAAVAQWGNDNKASQIQSGIGNQVGVVQQGDFNDTTQRQIGNYNQLMLVVNGSNNTLDLNQTGNLNNLSYVVNGSNVQNSDLPIVTQTGMLPGAAPVMVTVTKP